MRRIRAASFLHTHRAKYAHQCASYRRMCRYPVHNHLFSYTFSRCFCAAIIGICRAIVTMQNANSEGTKMSALEIQAMRWASKLEADRAARLGRNASELAVYSVASADERTTVRANAPVISFRSLL